MNFAIQVGGNIICVIIMIILTLILSATTILGLFVTSKQEIIPILSEYPEFTFIIFILTVFVIIFRKSTNHALRVGYANHISPQEFEFQKTVFTNLKVKQLLESPQYQEYARQRGNL